MKKFLRCLLPFASALFLGACNLFEVRQTDADAAVRDSSVTIDSANIPAVPLISLDTTPAPTFSKPHSDADTVLLPPSQKVVTGNVHPDAVIRFAKSLLGTPYVYASVNPKVGFDCSGFITYVFNHFGIAVPRSSVDFTTVGKTVSVLEALPGDLILFTGTDSTERRVGHMGLIVSNDADSLRFIHSSSGKAMGVIITALNGYYKKRFVRIARIFPENGFTATHDANLVSLPAPAVPDSGRTVAPPASRHHRNKTGVARHQSKSRRRRSK